MKFNRGKGDGNGATQDGQRKDIRGMLSLGHAFFNQYKSNSAEEKEDKHRDRVWIRRGAIATITYTFLTVVIVIFSFRQISISRDTEVRQLRGYLGIVAHSISIRCIQCSQIPVPTSPTLPEDIQDGITFELKNFGLTPALKPWMCADVKAVSYGEPITKEEANALFSECDRPSGMRQLKPTVWPTEGRPWSARLRSPSDIVAVRNKKASVFFFGRVNYQDVFGYSRNTYFCFQYAHAPTGEDGFLGCGGEAQPIDD